MASFRQDSFAAGEFAEELWGRHSLERYALGLRRCRNFFGTVLGALVNRPGFELDEARLGKDHNRLVRIVEFIFSEEPGQAFVIEFGHLYVRFHAGGSLVLATGAPAYDVAAVYELNAYVTYGGQTYRCIQAPSGGNQPDVSPDWWVASDAYELPTPYTEADLALMKISQVGDVLSIARRGHPPRELTRISNAPVAWKLEDVDFAAKPFWKPSTYYTPYLLEPLPSADATHLAKRWRYHVTAVLRAPSGVIWETLPIKITKSAHEDDAAIPPVIDSQDLPDEIVVYTDRKITIRFWINTQTLQLATPEFELLAFRYYRGKPGGQPGYLGEASTADVGSAKYLDFEDFGDEPDWTITPPQGLNPFEVKDSSGALLRTETPAIVTHFEQRRLFGSTAERPRTIFGSRTGDHRNFDVSLVKSDEHPLTIEIATSRGEEIRSLVPGGVLLAMTSSTETVVQGAGDGAPLSPIEALTARPRTFNGSTWLDPIIVGDGDVFFEDRSGGMVRRFRWDGNRGAWDDEVASLLSAHLVEGRRIVSWCYQRRPWSVIWIALDDGTLLSVTVSIPLQVLTWARHETDGAVESLAAIPEGGEDRVYAVVRRTVGGVAKRFVERMASRKVSDGRLGVFLDSSLSFDGRNAGATTVLVTGGIEWTAGEELAVETSADVFAGAGDVDDRLVLQPDAKVDELSAPGSAAVGLTVVAVLDARHATVRAEATVPNVFRGVPSTSWGWARNTFTGLDHLEGREVTLLADGSVQGPFTVAGGQVQLDQPAVIVHAGLPYTQEVETLDFLATSSELRTKTKTLQRVILELFTSGPELWVGEAFDETLRVVDRREVAHGYGAIPLGVFEAEVTPASGWGRGGRAAIRCVDPMPVELRAVTREVELGGR